MKEGKLTAWLRVLFYHADAGTMPSPYYTRVLEYLSIHPCPARNQRKLFYRYSFSGYRSQSRDFSTQNKRRCHPPPLLHSSGSQGRGGRKETIGLDRNCLPPLTVRYSSTRTHRLKLWHVLVQY
ncbi:hypothetical protein HOY80DRAFT_200530 [Tuber brumale]|nr:hypothetical protein HOY80DRAFT_200530 [Tuber brumale]